MLNNLLDKMNFKQYVLYAHEDDCCDIARKVAGLGGKEIRIRLVKANERTMSVRFTASVYKWRTIRNELDVFRVFEKDEIPKDIESGNVYTVD